MVLKLTTKPAPNISDAGGCGKVTDGVNVGLSGLHTSGSGCDSTPGTGPRFWANWNFFWVENYSISATGIQKFTGSIKPAAL